MDNNKNHIYQYTQNLIYSIKGHLAEDYSLSNKLKQITNTSKICLEFSQDLPKEILDIIVTHCALAIASRLWEEAPREGTILLGYLDSQNKVVNLSEDKLNAAIVKSINTLKPNTFIMPFTSNSHEKEKNHQLISKYTDTKFSIVYVKNISELIKALFPYSYTS